MYFTDTPELRKFEREMRQKPNFDRRNDDNNESEIAHFSDNKKLMTIKIRSPTNGYCLSQN